MTEKNNSVQQAAPKKETLTDTSADAERPRLLAHLQTTVIAQIALSIPMPAACVKSLHAQEPALKTTRIKLADNHSRPRHRVVRHYVGGQTDSNTVACNERNAIQSGV